MNRPDKYAILDAARSFLKLLRDADDEALDAVYQVIATNANNSDYASTHEPMAAEAFQRETKRRLYNNREEQ